MEMYKRFANACCNKRGLNCTWVCVRVCVGYISDGPLTAVIIITIVIMLLQQIQLNTKAIYLRSSIAIKNQYRNVVVVAGWCWWTRCMNERNDKTRRKGGRERCVHRGASNKNVCFVHFYIVIVAMITLFYFLWSCVSPFFISQPLLFCLRMNKFM